MFLKFIRFQKIPQHYGLVFLIRHFDAYGGFSRDGGFHTDVCRRQIQLNIIRQRYDFAHLYALLRLQFIAGNSRSAADIGHSDAHAKILENLLQLGGCLPQFLLRSPLGCILPFFEQFE